MKQEVILGIDGGGTYTRVVVADLSGNIIGFAKDAGVHPEKNKTPELNIKNAIKKALDNAKASFDSVLYIVAGFAGFNREEDKTWAQKLLQIDDVKGKTVIINDAEVAQYGAFLGKPGIVAIAGTGSAVLGKTESGRVITNRDFHHHTMSGARYLSYSVLYDMIAGKQEPENIEFVNQILHYWDVNDIDQLRHLVSSGFSGYELDAVQELSEMSILVTKAAMKGNKIAYNACERVVDSLYLGIQLVASVFSSDPVPVSIAGGVANSAPIYDLLMRKLHADDSYKTLTFQRPILPPVLGALIYAYQELNIDITPTTIEHWQKTFVNP